MQITPYPWVKYHEECAQSYNLTKYDLTKELVVIEICIEA